MSDQGEKIIHLAREMLRGSHEIETTKPKDVPDNKKMSAIKIAALSALVASLGGASLTHLIDEARRPINRYERIEIEALMFYAVKKKLLTQEALHHEIEAALSLSSVTDMTALDYRRVRDYLRERIQG